MSSPSYTTHETSGFINNNTVDSQGRNLLTSSSESGHKQFTRRRKRKPSNKVIALVVGIFAAIIVVIVLLVVNFSSRPNDDPLPWYGGPSCPLDEDNLEMVVAKEHSDCFQIREVADGCVSGKWSSSVQSNSLISPLYKVTSDVCGVHISLSMNYSGSVQVHILSSKQGSNNWTITYLEKETCNHVFIKDQYLLKDSFLRILLLFPVKPLFIEEVNFHLSAFPFDQDPCCDWGEGRSIAEISMQHSACSKTSSIVKQCSLNEWRGLQERNTLISPTYTLNDKKCGVHVTLQVNYTGQVEVRLISNKVSDTNVIKSNVSEGICSHITIQGRAGLEKNSKIKVMITFKSNIDFPDTIYYHISAIECPLYKSIQFNPVVITNPSIAHIGVGHINLCSLELKEDRSSISCDWWNRVNGDSNDFIRAYTHECISSGVKINPIDTSFLYVDPKPGTQSTALMVSPIIERKSTSILFEFWYLMKCIGPIINVYLVPARHIVSAELLMEETPVKSISKPANHSTWKHEYERLLLPPEHDSYQLVIEGVLPDESHTHCAGHYCMVSTSTVNPAQNAVIAIDDISIQLMHRTCNATKGGATILNCKFQNATGHKTTCNWKSTGYSYDTYDYLGDVFDDWRAVNSGDGDINQHGATNQHLEGRGYIMTFDATGKAEADGSVTTPRLVTNSSCSCTMRFLYLLRGVFTPRMLVNIVYDYDTEDARKDVQWSLFGHQSEDWEMTTIPLNLHSDRGPFVIQISVSEIIDSKSDIHFDDLEFIDCDFAILEQ